MVAPSVALACVPPAPCPTQLSLLVLELALRESELAGQRSRLQALQARYLREIGGLQGQLFRIRRLAEDEEIRAGIRPPREEADPPDDPPATGVDGVGCSHEAISPDLKRLFREIARRAHPDLAGDDAARHRRHSIMAEANRAYAERDEDRLRLIMHAWRHEPDRLALGRDAAPDRLRHRLAEVSELLLQLDVEAADLQTSAIADLQRKVDRTRAEGWDLFREMAAQLQREVARVSATLLKLQRRRVED